MMRPPVEKLEQVGFTIRFDQLALSDNQEETEKRVAIVRNGRSRKSQDKSPPSSIKSTNHL
jgi:hypothetical protein